MHMDEGAAVERGKKADEKFQIIPITSEVLTKQAEATAKHQKPRLEDPLAQLAANYEYKVRPHDVLTVIVWDHPELTIPAGEFRSEAATGNPVAADGTMFYPYVGTLEVAGKSLRQIRELVVERLAKYITKPQLDVKVAAFRSQKVQVSGEVMAPSTIPITDVPMRALEAINLAKGFSPEANLQDVTLTRQGKVYSLDLLALQERGDVSQNWLLQDGDVLHVPDRSRNRVYVMGEVKKPSARLMIKGRMTLADALGEAEGVDPLTSNPGRIYVIRGAFESPAIYRLDANSPDALLLAIQFQLKPHDVVYVSTYELTRWNRIMTQILPTVQALWQSSLTVTNAANAVVPFVATP
ncbi:MAG: polysaccharide export protein [Myxococcota bacterium]|nr:polysaccharide export protein [Myxococcota bacterium]